MSEAIFKNEQVTLLSSSVSRKAGGLFGSMRGLATATMNQGVLIKIVSLNDEFTKQDLCTWGGIPVSAFPILGPKFFGYSPDIRLALINAESDLIHTHGLWMYPSFATAQWSRNLNKPYIVTPHGMLDPWAVKNSYWKKKLAGLIYEDVNLRGAACIQALCEPEFHAIRAYGLKGPVAVIPNGIDLPDLKTDLPDADWSENFSSDSKVLLFLGRLHPKKGLDILLKAWAKAHKQGVTRGDLWQLVIAGWDQGGFRAELEQLAYELGIDDSVHFVGPQFDVAKASSFSRADAFILPSLSEGLPIAVLEAWSFARPVLMTPNCNLPEGFAVGAAIRIEPDAESVFDGLGSLFSMCDSERLEMGARGRELVEKQFTWSRVGLAMAEVYRWVLGRGPRPDCIRTD